MAQTLIRNGFVISMNAGRQAFENGDVLVEDDRIKAVGVIADELIAPDADIVDATDCIVLPGLVNSHVHTSQQLERGLADDVDLLTWLHERTWPFESALTEEDSYLSSLACGLELIHSGVTTFAEAGGQHVDGMGRAVTEIGLRAALCESIMDCGEGLPKGWVRSTDECMERQVAHYEKWHGAENGRIRMQFGLRTIFNCSDELLVRSREMAEERGIGIHMHVAEVLEEVQFAQKTRGAGTVEHMNRIGALSPNLLAVHTVWLTPRDMDLFRLHDVKVSHNPAAAMRVLGFAYVPELLSRGLAVSIGTDGAPSNNRMDMIDEMWLTTLIHKGRTLNPATLPAVTILEMATLHGARCMLWEDEIGSLEPGKKADLVIVHPRSAGTLPVHDPVSAMVYSMHSSDVESSMCDGRWLMRDGKVLTVDEKAVLEEAKSRAAFLRKKAGIELPDRFPTVRVR
ncbi:5-methylthioadenosine/S-adenosylhomocysteine deaminase [Desulfobaculum xiamenense]|uniref:5-methylthioadenosine/S-adenosylhomocysteine deaminase n=1 Tax=Desulfobaculum xiamenense TaxID=995050 RepID=A0A846QXJ6_9BACT|nr:amidohydrolase [Desulfobaculum xiamenense]NJB69349.1 5-methylthioadenosine/S-adenosylhomocysteine deaminase [Desulfobaculum xiamenense]